MTPTLSRATPTAKPVILLAFANDRGDGSRYLRNLPEEARRVRNALRDQERRDLCEVVERSNATITDLLDTFQDAAYRNRIAIFHYGGHADSYHLLLENSAGQPTLARADHLAAFLGQQQGLRLVFLNGCSTQQQVQGLLAANVDAVIATDADIMDEVAMHFAERFYRGLASGATIQVAYHEAAAAARLIAGESHGRHLRPTPASAQPQSTTWPWGLHHRPGDEAKLQWRLNHSFLKPEADVEPAPGESPYKGLHYFDTEDALRFFGREALTAELVAYLRTHHFLAVVGASGSGKSSVVRAGVVPALQRGEPLLDGVLPPEGSAQWPVHIITPTARPLEALAAKLTRDSESVTATSTLIDDLSKDARSLHLYARRLIESNNRLLLVVDQFEELFTLCKDQAERKAFVDNLLTAAVEDGVTTVIITLRADFYAHCFAFDNLRSALGNYQIPIGPMSKEELRRAIEEPARLGGWAFEPGLVDLLLTDVGKEPGALPLLSHALLETWKRRRGHTLTLAGYAESGRVQGAIAQTAESVFNQRFTPEQQTIAKNIFLRLTELGEGSEDTRRRVQLAELMPQSEGKATIETVLKTLADARLVTTDKDEVEVAHEALIRSWPTLRRWLDENRDGLRIERRMADAAHEWEDYQRNERLLYIGSRFEQAWEWVKDRLDTLNKLERDFIEASRTLVEVEKRQLEVERLLREAREAKQVGNGQSAIAAFEQASKLEPNLNLDIKAEIEDVRRQVATRLVQEGERLAAKGDYAASAEKFNAALSMEPPPDTPVYVWIPPGTFLMGSDASDRRAGDNEKPQYTVYVDGFWIMRVPVTNAQYKLAVEAGACSPPNNQRWDKSQFAQHPVTNVTWNQATEYARWVGGRLPTEAGWEKAARGTDGRIYPWGNNDPTPELCNYSGSGLGTWTDVGSYPAGQSPYGLLDMAGNVAEWTSSQYQPYPYKADDGREVQTGDANRTLRGGAFISIANNVRCANRYSNIPTYRYFNIGFRVVSPGF